MPTTVITNMPRQRKAVDLLGEQLVAGCRMDIFSCNFEAAAFLLFGNKWSKASKIRVLIGSHQKPAARISAWERIAHVNDQALELAKAGSDDIGALEELKSAIKSGQIEIRSYFKEKLSGAAYVISPISGDPTGMIGSTDFTVDDLRYPIELNVQLDKEQSKDLRDLFEKLFAEADDIGIKVDELVDRHTRAYSPYDVYIKSLYEYFRGREITAGVWEEQESKVYPLLSGYQKDGYRQLLHIAGKYNGALLCDGVGLGKTYVALMMIERLIHDRKRVAVIVPKSTRDAVWKVAINRHISNAEGVFGKQVVVYNHTDLLRQASGDRNFPSEMDEIRDRCDAIIIDEAHHFRNLSSKKSQKLFELTDNKLVFLLTATPINNSLFDLQHLMDFFTRRDDSRFGHLGINSIRGHFIQKERLIEKKMGVAESEVEGGMFADFDAAEAERILCDDTLFREVVVQRSRVYVTNREQMGTADILFPKRHPPAVADYSLVSTYGGLLKELRRTFDREDPLLKLPIYYPMAYARKPVESVDDRREENRQRQVVGLVRSTMLKRFESSWKSFQYTCEDLLLKLLAAVQKMDEKQSRKWRDENALWLQDVEKHIRERFGKAEDIDEIEEGDLLDDLADRLPDLDPRIYKTKDIIKDVIDDLNLLVTFLGYLRGLSAKEDTKVQKLIELLTKHPLLSKHKVIIFSEFRDTARYVHQTLKDVGLRNIFEIDSSSDVNRLEVIRRFAPYYNYDNEEQHRKALSQPIRVLISTDILAEGLNLQDAFLLINYDLHWNPVRLMQRIGRVDRRMNLQTEEKIKSAYPEETKLRGQMWYWNFLPPAELNDLLSLYHRVTHKVLRISETTGLEGQMLLTPDDHFRTLKDFNAAYEGQASTEESLRLMLNKALQDDPALEAYLEALPWRLFSAKDSSTKATGVFACYRFPSLVKSRDVDEPGELRWYFLPDSSGEVLVSLEQIDAHIRAQRDTPRSAGRPLEVRRERLKVIETYIRSRELKARKSLTMAHINVGQDADNTMRLVAWMEVGPS